MQLLTRFEIVGLTPIAWSPPSTFLGGRPGGKRVHVHKKNPKLCAWQDTVREALSAVWHGDPHLGPVLLRLTFTKGTPNNPELWGRPWWNPTRRIGHGDHDNLAKAVGDALQPWEQKQGPKVLRTFGGVIRDDSQVSDSIIRTRYGARVLVEVYAVEDREGGN
jgi:Holliday junction resolvase RusA-like endonuclease